MKIINLKARLNYVLFNHKDTPDNEQLYCQQFNFIVNWTIKLLNKMNGKMEKVKLFPKNHSYFLSVVSNKVLIFTNIIQ